MRESILIVREDRTGRRLLGEILRQAGYEIQQATSALEAMMIALCSNRPVDLLLTDVGLRGIDGWQLAEKLRQAFPATRVVYMGGEAEMRESCDRHSCLLSTTVEAQGLLAVVRGTLDSATCRKEPARAVRAFEGDESAELRTA